MVLRIGVYDICNNRVDKVLIVTEPSFLGLHDMKRTLKLLITLVDTSVIINKYDLNECLSSKLSIIVVIEIYQLPGKFFNRLMVDAMINCKSVAEFVPEDE